MTEQEILEGNKLIAEFMGIKLWTDGEGFNDVDEKEYPSYHKSWDWLMSAWIKFRKSTGLPVFAYESHRKETEYWIATGNIDFAFEELVKAIKWYNSLSK